MMKIKGYIVKCNFSWQSPAQASRAEHRAACLNKALQDHRRQVESQAREALRAAVGLEQCVTSGQSADHGDSGVGLSGMTSITDLADYLGLLKESLWQLLVLGTKDHVQETLEML